MNKSNLKALFKKKGLKVTPQRLAVYEAVINDETHPSAEDVYKTVKEKYANISTSTVYQILNLLVDLGQVYQIDVDGVKRYENKPEFHFHAVCPKCNKIDDLSHESFEQFWHSTMKELDIEPINQEIKVYRYCKECKKKLKE